VGENKNKANSAQVKLELGQSLEKRQNKMHRNNALMPLGLTNEKPLTY
jgi:hypothetical protein